MKQKEIPVSIIAVYVDDILIAGRSDERIADWSESNRFNVKDMGNLYYFLGVKVVPRPWSWYYMDLRNLSYILICKMPDL